MPAPRLRVTWIRPQTQDSALPPREIHPRQGHLAGGSSARSAYPEPQKRPTIKSSQREAAPPLDRVFCRSPRQLSSSPCPDEHQLGSCEDPRAEHRIPYDRPPCPLGPQVRSFTSRERRGSTRQLALEIKPVQSNWKAEKKIHLQKISLALVRIAPHLGFPPFLTLDWLWIPRGKNSDQANQSKCSHTHQHFETSRGASEHCHGMVQPSDEPSGSCIRMFPGAGINPPYVRQ